MRSRKGSEYQLSCIWITFWNTHAGNPLVNGTDLWQVRKIKPCLDAVTVHIECHVCNIKVTGALTITEERTLNSICSSHQAEFCGCRSGATVVMSMQRNENRVPTIKVSAHPLDHVCVNIGRGPLHRIGQVDNHLMLWARLPDINHGVTTLQGEIQFSIRK